MLFVPACITFRQLVASFFPKMTIFRHLTLEFFHIICQAWRKQDTSSMRRTFPLPAVAVVTTKSVKSLYIHQKSLELEQKKVRFLWNSLCNANKNDHRTRLLFISYLFSHCLPFIFSCFIICIFHLPFIL